MARKYSIRFTGRKSGALGITYSIRATREAEDPPGAVLALYDEYDHISNPVVTDVETGETSRPYEAGSAATRHHATKKKTPAQLQREIDEALASPERQSYESTTAGTERPFYELKKTDVGKALINAFGRKWPVSDFIGRVLPTDVGKRVYKASIGRSQAPGPAYVLQIENDEQRSRRLGRPSKSHSTKKLHGCFFFIPQTGQISEKPPRSNYYAYQIPAEKRKFIEDWIEAAEVTSSGLEYPPGFIRTLDRLERQCVPRR
jgi:hypothetical protein